MTRPPKKVCNKYVIATVVVWSIWNSQDSIRASVPTKRISRNSDSGDLGPGKFCDPPIIRQWEKIQNILHFKCVQINFIPVVLRYNWCFRWKCWLLTSVKVSEVAYRLFHVMTVFFANNVLLKRDTDVRLVSLHFSRRDASDDMQHDLFRWPRDLDQNLT